MIPLANHAPQKRTNFATAATFARRRRWSNQKRLAPRTGWRGHFLAFHHEDILAQSERALRFIQR
jgi:hypothetical protein